MARYSGVILAVSMVAVVSATAHANLVAVDPEMTVRPMGRTNSGTLAPLKTFANDFTYVAGGRLYGLTCVSDATWYPTCSVVVTHKLAPGYDPKLSDVMLGGVRINNILPGSLPQGSTFSLGAEVQKASYDKSTGDFTFTLAVDFGPGTLASNVSFTAEVEYWIVLTNGTVAWTTTAETTCSGVGHCSGSTYFPQNDVPDGMTFMGSALQKFSMSVDAQNPDLIREFGVDSSHWYQSTATVWEPSSGKWVDRQVWRVDPTCTLIGQNDVWGNFTCQTRMLAFAALDGCYEVTQPEHSSHVDASAWNPTVQLTVPANARGVFTGLSDFHIAYVDGAPANGNKYIRAGCSKPTASLPVGTIVFEGVMADLLPPLTRFDGDINCLTGWARTP